MNPWLAPLLALAVAASAAAGAEPVKFSDALYAKFQDARCLQCHQFNSRRSNGRAWTSHRTRYLCENCHKPALTGLLGGEWMAPPGEKMDYTGYSARETCELIKRNTPTGDKAEVLSHHLLTDSRVLWAIKSGMTPAGRRPTMPGGYDEWARDVRAWVADGMICD
ncbi:hypothetical protein EZJ19_05235 [Parasulfuritortus cantonensis]|uniref:Cytochrome c domain-containing protein n=1 Tax=Parasulfuritortus cantonensis TaxID=2528202 RepID=A0A4R1BGU6_9PROT|nr:hypothetical protein [Parasulfuritortus cantonensis]TCJ16308.1 hypothetical protein EZJ19_05235 [Parasulfuritortus cantonensis]